MSKIVLSVGILSFLLQVSYILFSSMETLNTSWIIDDAYYYLKPALLFKHNWSFTFDGINQTYGFQPLWEIVLTILGFFINDKIFFVRAVLILSSIIYFFIGLFITEMAVYFYGEIKSIGPALIWYLNINLIQIFNSGMENILGALFLLLILSQLLKLDKFSPIKLGILSGFLILTRVNMIFVPILIFVFLKLHSKNYTITTRKLLFYFSSIIIIVLPWFIYAQNQFKQVLPASGTRKFIGVYSGFIDILNNFIPANLLTPLINYLPEYEKILLKSNNTLKPSVATLFEYLLVSLPGKAFTFGLRKIYTNTYLYNLSELKIFLGIVFLSLLTILIYVNRHKIKNVCNQLTNNKTLLLQFFLAIALVNVLINWIFLSTYMQYCIWYGFPEILFLLMISPMVIDLLISPRVKIFLQNKTILMVVLSILTINLFYHLRPNNPYDKQSFLVSTWHAKNWIDDNLSNQRIGAFSSGLLGYYVQNNQVINLDGLANSPGFAKEIYPNYILFVLGLTTNNIMLEYLDKNRITYIADASFIKNMNFFLDFVPEENYEIVKKWNNLINWKEPRGSRKYFIIKLKLISR